MRQRDYVTARELTEQTLIIARELGDAYRVSRILHQLAEIALGQQQTDEALHYMHSEHRSQSRARANRRRRRCNCAFSRASRLRGLGPRRLFAFMPRHRGSKATRPRCRPTIRMSMSACAKRCERRSAIAATTREWALGASMSLAQAVKQAVSSLIDVAQRRDARGRVRARTPPAMWSQSRDHPPNRPTSKVSGNASSG